MGRLENKVALITGGAGGIGSTTAKLFVKEGCSVMLADIDKDALKEISKKIGEPDRVKYIKCDVSSLEDNKKAVQKTVESFDGLDILLANAGTEGVVKPIVDYPLDTFDKVLDINVKGPFYAIRSAFPEIEKRNGGSIIITSSVAGLMGTGNVSAYTTSKHAVIGLMREAAKEGAPKNIRVNTVNPAPVDNRMMRSLESEFSPDNADQAKEQFESMIPLGRYADNSDVANMMLFLASDESSFVTGTVNPVDGGMTA